MSEELRKAVSLIGQ